MKISVLIISAMFMLLSCDSDSSKSVPEEVEPLEGVFVLGSVDGKVGYWHDGEWNQCEVPDYGTASYAYSMYINESDIYIGGTRVDSNHRRKPGYWMNLEWNSIDSINYGTVCSIVIENDDVLCGGHEQVYGQPCYWKNSEINLLTNNANIGQVNCLNKNDGNFYAAGCADGPVYWENDEIDRLTISSFELDMLSTIYTIVFNGADMYAAGCVSDTDGIYHTGYWKNNNWIEIENPFSDVADVHFIHITGIVFSDTDMYICGYAGVDGELFENEVIDFCSGYWKNGEWFELKTTHGTPRAYGITEHEGDIYIVAECYEGYKLCYDMANEYYAGYWKNGEWHPLGEEGVKTQAFDIVVK